MRVSSPLGGQPITVQRRGGDAYRAWSTAPLLPAGSHGPSSACPYAAFSDRQGWEPSPGIVAEHPRPARRRRVPRQGHETTALSEADDQTTRGDAGCCVSFFDYR